MLGVSNRYHLVSLPKDTLLYGKCVLASLSFGRM